MISLSSAVQLFGNAAAPPLSEIAESKDRELTREIELFMVNKTWLDIAESAEFSPATVEAIDLGNIPTNLSRTGLRYYLPGLLLHFLRVGVYETNLWGPTFYYNFIRRLQSDDPSVLEYSGSTRYFDLSILQRRFSAEIMAEIYKKYGDNYQEFDSMGYEHIDTARCSIKRALKTYWQNSG